MATPNPDIYGAPNTWHDCYFGGGSTQPWAALLHAEKAKVPTWDTAHTSDPPTFENSQLRYAVDDNKLTPTEPIDNTICAVGQGISSPFRQFTLFRCDGTTEHPNGEILQVGHAYTKNSYDDIATPINTFWFESNSFTSAGTYGNGAFSRGRLQIRDGATITQGIDQRIWSPSGVNSHGTNRQNGNFYIAPFVSYGSRSYVLQILVWVTNADYDPDFTPGSGTPSGEWKTLEDWKNNYSAKAITACLLAPRSISTYNSSTGAIGYYRINYESSQYRKVSSGILDTIKFEFDDGSLLPDITDYGLFSASSNSNVGVALFNEMSLYKWSDTLQNIGIVNSYIASYIRSNGTFMTPYIPYSNDIYEWIMESCACFGMAFTPAKNKNTDASNCVFNQSFTDPDLCLPIITDSGIANGEYTRGSDNLNNDFIDLSSQWDKNYQPSEPIDPNTYSDTTNWNTVNFQSAFCKRYELTAAQVGQLAAELWAAQATKPADIDYQNFAIDEYLTNNPIDTIVSLKYFPCVVETAANPAVVHLGKYQTNIAANAISHTIKVIDFEPIEVFPHFDDFRDYEPYTTLQMYIPFCGTVSIPTAEAMGKWVSVKLCIDINTGACAGYVIVSNSGSGGICVATATGTASIDIPVSGLQSANLSQAIFNATANWTQTQISNAKVTTGLLHHVGELSDNARLMSKGLAGNLGIGDIASGITGTGGTGGLLNIGRTLSRLDPVQGMYNGMSMEIESSKSDYELSHIMLPMRLIGSTSPALSSVIESSCRLIIYRPITDEGALSHYADTVGFATVSSGVVSEYSGYTEGTIDVSGINASASEKSEIQRLFASGVYL